MKADYIFLLGSFGGFIFGSGFEGRPFIAIYRLAGEACVVTSAKRRKHIPVGSAKTSMFWKLAAVSTLRFSQAAYLFSLGLLLGFITHLCPKVS